MEAFPALRFRPPHISLCLWCARVAQTSQSLLNRWASHLSPPISLCSTPLAPPHPQFLDDDEDMHDLNLTANAEREREKAELDLDRMAGVNLHGEPDVSVWGGGFCHAVRMFMLCELS